MLKTFLEQLPHGLRVLIPILGLLGIPDQREGGALSKFLDLLSHLRLYLQFASFGEWETSLMGDRDITPATVPTRVSVWH